MSHARLQHVKDIMNAAGVTTLSDLDTLPVRQRISLSPGQIFAGSTERQYPGEPADVATKFRAAKSARVVNCSQHISRIKTARDS